MANTFTNIPTPFGNMSFTPDVPSQALQANEYNSGLNVQTNVRGIETVKGDQEILSQIPGTHIFVSAGFRSEGIWWFIVATITGDWYAVNGNNGNWTSITPTVGAYKKSQYSASTTITDSWSGTTLIINDGINSPMYLTPDSAELHLYDVSYPGQNPQKYIWNYTPGWTSSSAGFVRLFSTPNVGSILVAGNITAEVTGGFTEHYPTTVQWSRAFGLNDVPTDWTPTITNVANQLEVPVRGPVVDGFPCNGNFYVCSYWDTVIFSPISYQSTAAPILGVRLLNQGRGLLNENCWSNADQVVYGLDARDIWVFDGNSFQSLGNQRVKDWFYGYGDFQGQGQLNTQYASRVFTINNTAMNQFEIYYPDQSSTGWCNRMLSYRYDLDKFNAPREVHQASHAVEAPRYVDSTLNEASRVVVYTRADASNIRLIQKDTGTTFINNEPIIARFRRDNITFGKPYSNQIMVHRILPEVVGTGSVNISIGGALSVGATPVLQTPVNMPIDTDNPWIQTSNNNYRVVTVEVTSDETLDNQWNMTGVNWQTTIVEDSR